MIEEADEVYIGVDEAGRGAVIGPLSITAVSVTKHQLKSLENIIKYDSKKYTRRQRENFYNILTDIRSQIHYRNILIPPEEINDLMSKKISLNVIEAQYMAKAIIELVDQMRLVNTKVWVFIDSMYTDTSRCKYLFIHFLQPIRTKVSKLKVTCEHKADEKYLPVRLASIISKVIRDNEIKKLKTIWGELGSGYPSDPKTIEFLKSIKEKRENDNMYRLIRIYWKTWKKMVS